MSITTIGLVSPGDMGHVLGKVLQSHGLRVLTCLKGWSERTHMLARGAQIEAVPTYEDLELANFGLDIRPLGPDIGLASGIKMCYASLTKGMMAIVVESLVTAHTMGLYDALVAELRLSQGDRLRTIERQLPVMPTKAGRWISEMEEIAKTFGDLGLTPRSISAPPTFIASWERRHWQRKHLKPAIATARWRRSSKG